MLFGLFKTKNEKRIEELERLLARPLPRVVETTKCNVERLSAKVVIQKMCIPSSYPIYFCKRDVARKMTEKLMDAIDYKEYDDEMGNHIIEGTLKVVIDETPEMVRSLQYEED